MNITVTTFGTTVSTAADTIVNIENVNVTYDALADSTFDARGVITAGNVDVTNVRAGSGADISVTGLAGGALTAGGFVDVTAAMAGDDRDLEVTSADATGTVTADTTGTGVLTVTANTASSIDASTAAGGLTITADAATTIDGESTSGTITISGDADADIDADSTSAGNIAVTAAASTDVVANTTGAGTVTVSAEGDAVTTVARSATINLEEANTTDSTISVTGTGDVDTDDSVVINNASEDIALTNVVATNAVESVTVNADSAVVVTLTGAAETYTATGDVTFAGAETLFDGLTATGGTVRITDVAGNADLTGITSAIEISDADIDAPRTVSLAADADVTISGELDEELIFNADDSDADTTLSVDVNVTLTEDIENDDGVSGVAELTFVGAAGADAITTATITVEAEQTDLLLDAGDTTVTFLGSEALRLDADNVAVDVAELNASGYTGAITATIGAITASTGSGNDVLTVATTSADLDLSMGAGNDTVTVDAGITGTIDGGDGTDTLDIAGDEDVSGATLTSIDVFALTAKETITVTDDQVHQQGIVITSNTGAVATLAVTDIGTNLDLSNLAFADAGDAVTVDYNTSKDSALGASVSTTITGSMVADDIDTHDGADQVFGGAGNDAIDTYEGADYVEGGAGDDVIGAGGGDDTVLGEAGNDTINGNDGADSLDGGAGDDSITGGAGNDTITAGEGSDTVDGGAGEDSIILTETTSSADTVTVSAVVGTSSDSARVEQTGTNNNTGADTLTGFTFGTDGIEVTLTNVSDFVHGDDTDIGLGAGTEDGSAIDFTTSTGLISTNGDADFSDAGDIAITFVSPSATLTETRFENALTYNVTGTAAADTITTGAGDDVITGGADADILNGGAGADTFVYTTDDDSTAAATDTIANFTIADDILNFKTAVLVNDVAGPVDVKAAEAGGGGGLVITASVADGIVTLAGSNAADIDTQAEALAVLAVVGVVDITDVNAVEDSGVIAIEAGVSTYVAYLDDGAVDGTFAIENFVELTGVTGLTAIDLVAAANTLVIA